MTTHTKEVDVAKGAKKINAKYAHITAGHPIHNTAVAIHKKIKAAHPETTLEPEDFISDLCGDSELDDVNDGGDDGHDDGLDGDTNN